MGNKRGVKNEQKCKKIIRDFNTNNFIHNYKFNKYLSNIFYMQIIDTVFCICYNYKKQKQCFFHIMKKGMSIC